MRKLDNHNRVTLYGIFLECENDINDEVKNYKREVTRRDSVNYRTFAKVINLYFKIAFKLLIEGKSVPLLNKFGILNVVKTKCIRYSPQRLSFYKNELGERIRKTIECKTNFGYWHFVFWDAPKILRHYKFNIDIQFKGKFMKKVDEGFEYLDYSLDGYGRCASTTYIQHIK